MPPLLDIETALIAELVDNDVLDGHLSTRLPRDFAEHLPYGTLKRAPGSRYIDTNTLTLEAVRLQLNTYGEQVADGDAGAFAAMGSLITAIVELEGIGLGDPAAIFITNVDVTPPWWYPDPDTERPGYIGFVSVFAKAYAHLG